MRTLLMVGLALLTGCASHVVSASERTVVVNAGSREIAQAQSMATAECGKYGRRARLVRLPRDDRTFVFDCDL